MREPKVVLVVLFAVFALTVGVSAVSAQETATGTPTATATETPTTTATETPTATETESAEESDDDSDALGTQLTAFLQSSSAAANDSVENGMWRANFERASEGQRGDIVTKRAGTLDRRLDRLQAQNESLQERYESGAISEQAYVAQQSQLAARIDGLKTAVADTDTAAQRTGVDDAGLEQLVQSASELKGPEVAAIARGLAGGPKADAPGRSGDRPGGPSSAETTEQNETADNETRGRPGNSGNGPENPGKSGEAGPSEGSSSESLAVGRSLDALLPF